MTPNMGYRNVGFIERDFQFNSFMGFVFHIDSYHGNISICQDRGCPVGGYVNRRACRWIRAIIRVSGFVVLVIDLVGEAFCFGAGVMGTLKRDLRPGN